MNSTNRKRLRILMLAHYFSPEMGAAAARVHGLARWLVNFGHDVTVLTGFPNYPSGMIPKAYRGKLRTSESLDGIRVLRTWVYASSKQSVVRRLANYFSFVASSTITGLRRYGHHDIVLASSPPLFIGLAGLAVARVYRVPFVFDIRDIWPELAVEAGQFHRQSAIVRWGEKLERFLYGRADRITLVTRAKMQKLMTRGVPHRKLTLVPNGVDFDLTQVGANSFASHRLNLKGKFVVTYAGLIGVFQGLEIVLHAASILRSYDNIHFLIVGDGVKRRKLQQEVNRQHLANISFLPSQPREAIPGILSASDVALVPLVTERMIDAVPSKLLEAWGCRCPAILMARGEAQRIMEESGGGIVIKPGEPEELARSILELTKRPERLERFAELGFRYAKKHFDRSNLARQMEETLLKTIEKKRTSYA